MSTNLARRPWVLAATMATMFIAAIEGTIVATAMPTIVSRLGGFDLFSWVFTSYLLTQAVTIPIYGKLADLYGRKRVLFVGIFLFLVGSVLCGFAWTMVSLIVFRAVQGVGAGGILPVAMTIVGDLYTPAERARIQGWLSGVWGVAAIIGPWLGAVIVAHFSWSLVFWINVPIGAVAVIMLAAALRETVQHRQHRIDYLGSTLLALGTGTLMFALVQAATLGLGTVVFLVATAAVLFAAFFVHESRAPEPMLPLQLWRNRIIAGGNIANLAFGAVMMGFIAFLPAYIQGVMERSAFTAAVALMVMSMSWSVGAILTGRLMLRTSYRAGAATGGIILVAGSLTMIGLDPASGLSWLGAGALLTGLGLGFISNSFVVATQSSVDWAQRGVATSTILFTRMIGQSIGAAVFGGILNARLSGQLASGGDIVNKLMEPALRQSLSAAERMSLTQAIADALHNVFLIDGGLALIVLAASLWLPPRLSPRTEGVQS
jgi:EmrB/QacA subfamily drug resistance transporter